MIVRFQKPEFEIEKLEVLDIIASSFEEPTQGNTNPTDSTDPYEIDKW